MGHFRGRGPKTSIDPVSIDWNSIVSTQREARLAAERRAEAAEARLAELIEAAKLLAQSRSYLPSDRISSTHTYRVGDRALDLLQVATEKAKGDPAYQIDLTPLVEAVKAVPAAAKAEGGPDDAQR